MDNLTRTQRKKCMSRIKSKDTKPERIVRRLLDKLKVRYSTYSKKLPGRPDIVISKNRKVIFINGCFWHQHKGCKRQVLPKTNKEYWLKKLDRNIIRQKKDVSEIRKKGWKPIIVWECQIKNDNYLVRRLRRLLT